MLIAVDPRYPGVWDDLAHYLAQAIERGDGGRDWGLEDMRERIESGHVMLWAFVVGDEIHGAGLTCKTVYPRRAVLEILAFGADPGFEEDWLAELPWLGGYAKQAGMSAIIGTGRPGWVRKLEGVREKRAFEIDLESGHE